jgi:GNAT superfamily N-acetyltransferase
MAQITFRPYRRDDKNDCVSMFDANCPAFFAPNERAGYEAYLDRVPASYEVCEVDGRVSGGFGIADTGDGASIISWILLSPDVQGMGIGSQVMNRVIRKSRAWDATLIRIATSPKAADFFARFGAVRRSTTKDGWGPGMDRVDMELPLHANPPAMPGISLPAGED